jgi:hypothetical protein
MFIPRRGTSSLSVEHVEPKVQIYPFLFLYDEYAETLSERDINNAAYDDLRQELGKYAGETGVIARARLLGVYESPQSAALDLSRKNLLKYSKHRDGHRQREERGTEWLELGCDRSL